MGDGHQFGSRKRLGIRVAQLLVKGDHIFVLGRCLERLCAHVSVGAVQHETLPTGDASDVVVLRYIDVPGAE
ncbi:hypothetical protein D3C79_1056690 [compost metagenome]